MECVRGQADQAADGNIPRTAAERACTLEFAPRVGVEVDRFAKVADALATDALRQQAARTKEAVSRLLQDAQQQPALSALPRQDVQMVQTVRSGFVPERPALSRADDRFGAYATLSRQAAMAKDTGDALAALEAINLRCSDTIVDLAGRTDSTAVRQALGADFDSYRRAWQDRKERRDNEARREAETSARADRTLCPRAHGGKMTSG